MSLDKIKSLASSAVTTINSVKNLGSSIENDIRSAVGNIGSALRGGNIRNALAGNAASAPATATFSSDAADWRVKLSMPTSTDYTFSQILTPLKNTGGLVFPFTPSINISHSANYQSMDPMHNNYPFVSYQNSKVDDISITGEFICENSSDAAYWVGAVHYLRSVTKMNYGSETENQGAPPPVVKLSGYGDYVFPNVPVVVKSFSVELPKDVDYISSTYTPDSGLSQQERMLNEQTAGMDTAQEEIDKQNKAMGIGQPSTGYAPTKSTITVLLTPAYSREQVRQFSLGKFVQGGYIADGGFV